MRRIEQLAGKYLYVPPVIFLCQRTGLTQYAVSNYLWMVVGWLWLARATAVPLFWTIVLGLAALLYTLRAGLAADLHRCASPSWVRFGFLVLALIEIIGMVVDSRIRFECQLALFAEYALTIRTIPPLETKERGSLTAVKPSGSRA